MINSIKIVTNIIQSKKVDKYIKITVTFCLLMFPWSSILSPINNTGTHLLGLSQLLTPSSTPRTLFPKSSILPPINCTLSLGLSLLLVWKTMVIMYYKNNNFTMQTKWTLSNNISFIPFNVMTFLFCFFLNSESRLYMYEHNLFLFSKIHFF